KTWIIDIDNEDLENDADILKEMATYVHDECMPIGPKVVALLASLSGFHFIVRPFDLRGFKEKYPNIEIKKDNPTNLYIP
ncbi:MAG: hypothetical protein WDA09_06725, partial [Bacteriovoracaceae bacterium]